MQGRFCAEQMGKLFFLWKKRRAGKKESGVGKEKTMKTWMKWCVVCVVIVLIAAVGIWLGKAALDKAKPSAEESKIPLKRNTKGTVFFGGSREYGAYIPKLKEMAAQNDEVEELDIPLYEAEELMYNTNGAFYIGYDSARYRTAYNGRVQTNEIFNSFPTHAIRRQSETMIYSIYRSDSGFYLYLFFSEESGDPDWDGLNTSIGYPIVIQKMLSYEEFAGVQVGDGVEKLREIDPVIEIYEEMFFEYYGLNSVAAENLRKSNDPISSVHYLKDGLLKIEYDIVDDTQLVVENIILNENYDLTNLYGETYNYRILPQDLPEA